jgi:hypothetical protein
MRRRRRSWFPMSISDGQRCDAISHTCDTFLPIQPAHSFEGMTPQETSGGITTQEISALWT